VLCENTHTCTVYEVEAQIGKKKRRFIRKNFDSAVVCRSAIRMHDEAKQAGLKVFPTYRISSDNKSILMTSGYDENHACVSNNLNSPPLESFGLKPLEEVPNFENFVRSLFDEAEKGIEKGIFIPTDSVFFVIDKDAKEVDFYIGDLDNVYRPPDFDKVWIDRQLTAAYDIAKIFVNRFVEENERLDYMKVVDEICTEYFSKYENS